MTGLSRRLAAAIALVGLPAAVIVAVVVALGDLGELLLAAAGAAVMVAAGWYLATRRGAERWMALVAVIAGLVVLVVGLGISEVRVIGVAAVAVLALISALAAQTALGIRVRDLEAAPTPGRPVGAANHAVLLINPKSGGGKGERFHLVDECAKRGIEAIVLERGDDLLALAEDAVDRGADVIGMAGGDGSQALVATVASRRGIPHVVVPAGTRNHFALDLGLDREDVVGALDAFADAAEVTVDLARINGRVFVNNASLGLYARIVQSDEYRDAKLRTSAAMLPDLLGPDATPLDLRFTGPGGERRDSASVILVSNNPYQLTSLGGQGTRERIDGGVLGIVAITIGGAVDLEKFVGLNAVGQGSRFGGWSEWTAERFVIESGADVDVGVDGEAMTLTAPLEFEIAPAALRVRLPRRAPGLSPAARRLGSSAPRELWAVLTSGDAGRERRG